MKKIIALVCSFLLCFSLSGCAKTPYEEIMIDTEQLKDKIENKETFVFMVVRDNCPYCESLYQYIEVSENENPNLVLYKLDCTDFKFTKNDDGTLASTTEEGKYLLELSPYFKYTPTIYQVEDGEILMTGVGFNESTDCVSVWPNTSIIEFDQANEMNYWDFISME